MSPRLGLAALLVGVTVGSVARAQAPVEVGGDVACSVGYDGNPAFSRAPGERLFPGVGIAERELDQSGLVQLDGDVGVLLGDERWASARLGAELGWLTLGERRGEGSLALDAGLSRGRGLAALGVSAGRYGATFGADDATWLGGDLRGGVRLRDLTLLGALESAFRFYDHGAQRDANLGGRVSLLGRVSQLHLDLGVGAFRRISTAFEARRTELVGQLGVRWLTPPFEAALQLFSWMRWFDAPQRDGPELEARLALHARLRDGLWLFGRVHAGLARGGALGLRYGRVVALGGIEVRLARSSGPGASAGAADELGAAVRVRAGRLIVRVHLPDAQRVSLVGTHNGWDEEAGGLVRGEEGFFEGDFAVAPGRHRYRFLVDGEPWLPEGVRTREDDFGGVDGVFEVGADAP